MRYKEQADIPEIAEAVAGRAEYRCPLCDKKVVGFALFGDKEVDAAGDVVEEIVGYASQRLLRFPPWCICGWNVRKARRALWVVRVMVFPFAFVGVVGALLSAYALAAIFIKPLVSNNAVLGAALVSVLLAGAFGAGLVARRVTQRQARALRHAARGPC